MSTITSQQQILEELISTEENYVRDLKDICEVRQTKHNFL